MDDRGTADAARRRVDAPRLGRAMSIDDGRLADELLQRDRRAGRRRRKRLSAIIRRSVVRDDSGKLFGEESQRVRLGITIAFGGTTDQPTERSSSPGSVMPMIWAARAIVARVSSITISGGKSSEGLSRYSASESPPGPSSYNSRWTNCSRADVRRLVLAIQRLGPCRGRASTWRPASRNSCGFPGPSCDEGAADDVGGQADRGTCGFQSRAVPARSRAGAPDGRGPIKLAARCGR